VDVVQIIEIKKVEKMRRRNNNRSKKNEKKESGCLCQYIINTDNSKGK